MTKKAKAVEAAVEAVVEVANEVVEAVVEAMDEPVADTIIKEEKEEQARQDIINELNVRLTLGKTRAQSAGWLADEHADLKDADRKALLDIVYEQRKAMHERAIRVLRTGKQVGATNASISENLCATMGWKKSTADTLIGYYSYMVEYARQINE